MIDQLIDSIKRFQEHILESGLARGVISLPTPRMLSAASSSPDDTDLANIFARIITETEIIGVSRDLYASGHYSLAVQESFKALDKYVAKKSGVTGISGTQLMDFAFSPKSPVLFWSDRLNQSEIDEQLGYHRLYSGAMLGIRNPVTHEFGWVESPEVALELIFFSQHLLKKAKSAAKI